MTLEDLREERQKYLDEIAENIGMPTNYKCDAYDKPWAEYDKVWVSVYTVTRHFGGREEGGWWYNRTVLERTLPTSGEEDVLREVCAHQLAYAIENGLRYGDIYSVLDGQDCYVCIETQPGMWQELETPRYE